MILSAKLSSARSPASEADHKFAIWTINARTDTIILIDLRAQYEMTGRWSDQTFSNRHHRWRWTSLKVKRTSVRGPATFPLPTAVQPVCFAALYSFLSSASCFNHEACEKFLMLSIKFYLQKLWSMNYFAHDSGFPNVLEFGRLFKTFQRLKISFQVSPITKGRNLRSILQ